MWLTDILPQWLPGPETLSTWPEMLGSVCGFREGAVCAAGETEPKARGSLGGVVHMMWAGGHHKVAKGTQRQPRMQNALKRGSLTLPDMATSGPRRLYFPCPANQGLWWSRSSPGSSCSHTSHGSQRLQETDLGTVGALWELLFSQPSAMSAEALGSCWWDRKNNSACWRQCTENANCHRAWVHSLCPF